MPTGYTCIIEEGNPTFKDYALRCARAFGALSHMREDRLDAPIARRPEDNEYAKRRLKEAVGTLWRLQTMTKEEASLKVKDINAKAMASWKQSEEARVRLLDKYLDMLAKVAAWVPPTPDHEGLKKFMQEQIQISMPSATPRAPPELLTEKDYVRRETEWAKDDIRRYEDDIKKSQERDSSANKWVEELVGSL